MLFCFLKIIVQQLVRYKINHLFSDSESCTLKYVIFYIELYSYCRLLFLNKVKSLTTSNTVWLFEPVIYITFHVVPRIFVFKNICIQGCFVVLLRHLLENSRYVMSVCVYDHLCSNFLYRKGLIDVVL